MLLYPGLNLETGALIAIKIMSVPRLSAPAINTENNAILAIRQEVEVRSVQNCTAPTCA